MGDGIEKNGKKPPLAMSRASQQRSGKCRRVFCISKGAGWHLQEKGVQSLPVFNSQLWLLHILPTRGSLCFDTSPSLRDRAFSPKTDFFCLATCSPGWQYVLPGVSPSSCPGFTPDWGVGEGFLGGSLNSCAGLPACSVFCEGHFSPCCWGRGLFLSSILAKRSAHLERALPHVPRFNQLLGHAGH